MEIKLKKHEVLELVVKHIREFLSIPKTHNVQVSFSAYGNEIEIFVEPKKEVADGPTL